MVQVLNYLQAKEVMHRDLKPQNILLDSDMNIKFVGSYLSYDCDLD
jgi:serine/threonine protein kinase